MDRRNIRGQWAGCSNFKERIAELNVAHEEFQRLLNSGFKVADAKVKHRRPRVRQSDSKVVMVFGKPMKLTMQEFRDHWTFTVEK